MLLICGQAYAAESITPPDNMHAHRKWAVAADALPEKIKRLKGFWQKYLPKGEGGKAPERTGYEDGSHVLAVTGCAWELVRAYIQTGEKDKSQAMVDWLQQHDSRSMLAGSTKPAGK